MGGNSKSTKGKKTKARKPAPAKAKAKARGRELREDELEKVAGGATLTFSKLGEARSDKHQGTIELESYSWGTTSPEYKELTLRKK